MYFYFVCSYTFDRVPMQCRYAVWKNKRTKSWLDWQCSIKWSGTSKSQSQQMMSSVSEWSVFLWDDRGRLGKQGFIHFKSTVSALYPIFDEWPLFLVLIWSFSLRIRVTHALWDGVCVGDQGGSVLQSAKWIKREMFHFPGVLIIALQAKPIWLCTVVYVQLGSINGVC